MFYALAAGLLAVFEGSRSGLMPGPPDSVPAVLDLGLAFEQISAYLLVTLSEILEYFPLLKRKLAPLSFST